jgi:hypothetical protein
MLRLAASYILLCLGSALWLYSLFCAARSAVDGSRSPRSGLGGRLSAVDLDYGAFAEPGPIRALPYCSRRLGALLVAPARALLRERTGTTGRATEEAL